MQSPRDNAPKKVLLADSGLSEHSWRAFHLVKISAISGSAVNGTRFVGSSHWKIPRKSGKSKKVGPFSRFEFPNGMSCSIYVSRSLYQFQVHGRSRSGTARYRGLRPNGTTFYQSEIPLLLPPKFAGFFLNGKRPWLLVAVNVILFCCWFVLASCLGHLKGKYRTKLMKVCIRKFNNQRIDFNKILENVQALKLWTRIRKH